MIVSERKYLKVCTQVDSSVPVESADIFSDGTSFTIFFSSRRRSFHHPAAVFLVSFHWLLLHSRKFHETFVFLSRI